MPEYSDLDRRLRAVERALTDGDHEVAALQDAAVDAERIDALEARIAELEDRTTELEAATQAVRGYVGNVRAVNSEVEDRADAALAAVDRIEARLDEVVPDGSTRAGGSTRERARTGPQAEAPANAAAGAAPRTLASDGYGIEMPPPGTDGSSGSRTNGATDDDDESGQSVIDRVREAL